MALIEFDPPVSLVLQGAWSLAATEHLRSVKEGDKTTLALLETLTSGEVKPRELEKFSLTNSEARQPFVTQFADRSGLPLALIEAALLDLYGQVMQRLKKAKPPPAGDPYYAEDAQGLWLVHPIPTGEQRTQLTNFGAKLLVDIVEDDGTHTAPRFFELEATQGDILSTVRLAAKDFQSMTWVAEALGAKARVFPGAYHKEHAHAAIQDLSPDIEHRHTYTHTGWRYIDDAWSYLHGAGAITAEGVRKDLSVALGLKFERYRLPLPVSGPDAHDALRASLDLRTLGPDGLMLYPLSCVYLAPLRELLAGAPPDFVMWLVGRTGSYKSEYAALALAHFGDFTRLTLPMTFETTGNGLERILHTPKDSLLVIDDYHPADSRREAEAMAQVASRLLRGMGNMASRQRMRRDTTMQDELPPRCLALATGELVPNGHSNNARMFLVSVPPLNPEETKAAGKALTTPQASGTLYAQAMATYLQWIAQQWSRLAQHLPALHARLRQDVLDAGCHTREPGQIAYLQLAWDTFTQCAVDHGAITAAEREAMLVETKKMFLNAVEEHAAVLQRENTVRRCLDYLRAGFASKQVYLRNTDDDMPEDAPGRWGWTPTTVWDSTAKEHVPSYDPKQAHLIGYVGEEYLYLIPKTLEQYLHHAAQAETRLWPVDMTTLLRELEGVAAIKTKKDAKGHVRRELLKKINKAAQRLIFLKLAAFAHPGEADDASDDDADVPF